MESDSDGARWGWAAGARRIATGTVSGNANGMDAAIQSNPDSGGFSPTMRCEREKGGKFLRQHRFVALVGDFEVAGEVQPILVAGKPT